MEKNIFFIRITFIKNNSYLCNSEHKNKETYRRLGAIGSDCANACTVIGSCSRRFQLL